VSVARIATDDELDDLDQREPSTDPSAGATTDPLSIHLGFVAVAITIGWVLLRALELLERATWGGDGGLELLVHLPLFPMAMLGGVALQLVLDRLGRRQVVDRNLINRIAGAALDLIIVSALGTLSLDAIGGDVAAFTLLAVAGIAWNVGALLLLAPRIVPEYAYERGLGDFGQSMGTTVNGLLLMRIADPANRSGGLEAFGYKQLLFEPVAGAGTFALAGRRNHGQHQGCPPMHALRPGTTIAPERAGMDATMRVLVAYATRHGATAGIAERIVEGLHTAHVRADARPVEDVDDVSEYDAFVVGSATYMYRWLKEATAFVERHEASAREPTPVVVQQRSARHGPRRRGRT
jgi:hypothetical protein